MRTLITGITGQDSSYLIELLEMSGKIVVIPPTENNSLYPRSPCECSKSICLPGNKKPW